MRPRVWLVPYAKDWSYGFNAQALARELAGQFDIRLAYKQTSFRELRAWNPSLAVDFWWQGHVRKLLPNVPVLKQVSSHRWSQERYGSLSPELLYERHLRWNRGVVVPSRRLLEVLTRAGAPRVYHVRKGYDPALFGDAGGRRGELVIGWAGNGKSADKRVDLLRAAVPDLQLADRDRPHEAMPAFYAGLDVIACASDAEGDPLTLIEGMASGCFPITTDVGIVPELVRHGENGLVVEQTAEAFAAAAAWCREHLEYVREAGRRNAEEMRRTRTWAHVAPDWALAFEAALPARP